MLAFAPAQTRPNRSCVRTCPFPLAPEERDSYDPDWASRLDSVLVVKSRTHITGTPRPGNAQSDAPRPARVNATHRNTCTPRPRACARRCYCARTLAATTVETALACRQALNCRRESTPWPRVRPQERAFRLNFLRALYWCQLGPAPSPAQAQMGNVG